MAPFFFVLGGGKGSPLNSTNQKRMPIFSHGHWASGVSFLQQSCCKQFSGISEGTPPPQTGFSLPSFALPVVYPSGFLQAMPWGESFHGAVVQWNDQRPSVRECWVLLDVIPSQNRVWVGLGLATYFPIAKSKLSN